MGIFDKLKVQKKKQKEGNIKLAENENVEFLASLSAEEKLAVSNLDPAVYLVVIMQKENANAARRVIGAYLEQNPKLSNSVKLLERLSVLELQQLGLSVHAAQKGVKAYSRGSLTKAKGHLEEACRHNPYSVDALCSLGVVIAKVGDYKEGVRTIKKALLLDPDNQSSRDSLSAIKRRRQI